MARTSEANNPMRLKKHCVPPDKIVLDNAAVDLYT